MKIYVVSVPFLSQYIGVAITQSGRTLKVTERPGLIEQVKFFMGCNGSTRLHGYYKKMCQTDNIDVEFVDRLPDKVAENFERREQAWMESKTYNPLPGGIMPSTE